MLRSRWIALLCVVLFLLAQGKALAHGFSHFDDTQPEQQIPHGKTCERCFGAAQLDHTAVGGQILAAPPARYLPQAQTSQIRAPQFQRVGYSARGPPSFL